MKTNLISKSETNEIIELVSGQWKQKIPKVKNFKVSTIDNTAQLITGNEIIILKINDNYLPFLNQNQILEKFPSVTVDMGAIKFMCSGANVMRPGIKKYTELFNKYDPVYKEIANTGVNRISIGEITHSVNALDIKLEI